uniref:tyrosine-type recombinase/integrase n=1 Tax=Bacillus thuringiensis TaxID=1428 RepID=UPI0011A54480
LLEKKEWKHFSFNNPFGMFLSSKEEIEKLLEETWYENNEYYRFQIEMKHVNQFIKKELLGKSETTQKTYKNSLTVLHNYLFLFEKETFPAFSEIELNRFIKYLHKEKELSSAYVINIFFAVMSYAKYKNILLDKEKIDIPKRSKNSKLSSKSLNDGQLDYLNGLYRNDFIESQMDHPNKYLPNLGRQRDFYRNWVLFRLMLATAMRVSEAISLKIDDLYLEGKRIESRYVHIHTTKTKEERDVPMDRETTDLVKKYIDFRNENDLEIEKQKEYFNRLNGRSKIDYTTVMTDKELKQLERLEKQYEKLIDSDESEKLKKVISKLQMIEDEMTNRYIEYHFKPNPYLFISNRNKKIHKDTAMMSFQRKGATSHQMRHTAIKRMMDAGVPLNKIKKYTGHKSTSMLLHYSEPTMEEVAIEVEKSTKKFDD